MRCSTPSGQVATNASKSADGYLFLAIQDCLDLASHWMSDACWPELSVDTADSGKGWTRQLGEPELTTGNLEDL